MAGDYSFNCLQCGSPIPIHAIGQSLSYACLACGALVEEDHAGLRILRQASQQMLWTPLLELGSKAKFRGETWQVLGFMVRCDGTEEYFWREYLLFNPYLGFRWLTEAEGHWNFIHMTRHRPSRALGTRVRWGGHSYRLFLEGRARVKFVLGEFYWRVKIDDECRVKDYIAPPDILSSGDDGEEEIWSAGTYVEPEDIQKSFKITGPMPVPRGVAPNQPSRYMAQRSSYFKHWLLFAGVLIALHLGFSSARNEKQVLNTTLVRHAAQPTEVLRSESFTLDDDRSNIRIQFYAPVSNSWLFLRSTLVAEDGQLPGSISFGRDLSRITNEVEGWAESHTSDEVFLNRLPKGRYHLEVTGEMGWEEGSFVKGQDLTIALKILSGVAVISPLILCLALLSLLPLWVLLSNWRFESARWSQSDVSA